MSQWAGHWSSSESQREDIAATRCGHLSPLSGERVNDARIQLLLDRLGRRWPHGGPAANPDVIRGVRPLLVELEETERAVAIATQDRRQADSREIILSRNVTRFEEHRNELAQRVMEITHQAFRQKSASSEAELRRVAHERRQGLREIDERLAVLRGELATGRREVRQKQVRLGPLRKRVSGLEETIGQFFPLITPAEEDRDAAAARDRSGAQGAEGGCDRETTHPQGDEDAVPRQDRQRTGPAQVRRKAQGRGLRRTVGERLRRIRWHRPRRRSRVRITRRTPRR